MQAERRHDRDAHAHRYVLLDHFPAADLERDGVGQPMPLEHLVHQPVRDLAFGRQHQRVLRDSLQAQLAMRQRVLGRGDQHLFEAVGRGVAEVGRHVGHRAHRQVGRIAAQQVGAVGADRVVQRQADIRVALAEALHDARQQVQDGRAVGRDVELAGIQPLHLVAEAGLEPVQVLHQRQRHFIQQLPFAAGHQAAAAALEQADAQLALQRLQLLADGRLTDEQRLSCP